VGTIKEIGGFCGRQWYMLPVAAAAVILFTVLHEVAHAAAVIVQGGQVTEFVWLPQGGRWGHIRFIFSHDDYSAFAIAVAPYCMWLAVSLGAAVLSLRPKGWPFFAASWIFVWLYTGPLGDIGYAAFGWLKGSPNDFHNAFGAPGHTAVVFVVVGTLAAIALGYFVQRRLYGASALSRKAYILLAGAVPVLLAL